MWEDLRLESVSGVCTRNARYNHAQENYPDINCPEAYVPLENHMLRHLDLKSLVRLYATSRWWNIQLSLSDSAMTHV